MALFFFFLTLALYIIGTIGFTVDSITVLRREPIPWRFNWWLLLWPWLVLVNTWNERATIWRELSGTKKIL